MADETLFTLKVMTDEDIIRQSEGKEVLNAGDYNLKGKDPDGRPIPGGLFDYAIFGKVKTCFCGFTRAKDSKSPPVRCPHCKSVVFSNSQQWEYNSAFFRLTIPVIFPYKVEKFWGILKKYGLDPVKPTNLAGGTGTWQAKLILLWNGSFHIEPTEKGEEALLEDESGNTYKLVKGEVDDYTPHSEIGLIGLYNLQKYSLKGVGPIDFSEYLNTVLPVTSTYFRNERPGTRNGRAVLELSKKTIQYRSIIEYVRQMPSVISSYLSSSIDIATIYYNLNIMVAVMMYNSEMLQGGKEHLTRDQLRTRVKRSGRANIVPALDIDMDHIYIPDSLAYEALNGDIINKLAEVMDYSEARDEVKARSVKAEQVYRELVDQAMVVMLRQPTLHKFSVMAFHPLIWTEPAIGIPIDVCPPLGADFDGDFRELWSPNQVNCWNSPIQETISRFMV